MIYFLKNAINELKGCFGKISCKNSELTKGVILPKDWSLFLLILLY